MKRIGTARFQCGIKDNMPRHNLTPSEFEMMKLAPSERSAELLFSVVNMTGEAARRILDSNSEENRKVRPERLTKIKGDILAGRWALTHQGICIDGHGVLIDGQHRLAALVAACDETDSDICIPMVVCRHYGLKLSDPIDQNAPRTVGFIAKLSPRQVTAVNTLVMLESGGFVPSATPGHAIEVYERYRSEFECIEKLPSKGMLGGFLAAMIWALPTVRGQERDRLLKFSETCSTGEGIYEGDGAMAFRRWRERPIQQGSNYNWTITCAALSCARYAVLGRKLTRVFSMSDVGYRAWTTRRREMGLLAPDTSKVHSLAFSSDR